MLSRTATALLGALCLVACQGAPEHVEDQQEPHKNDHDHENDQDTTKPKNPLEDQTYRRAITRADKYLVLWKPVTGDVPKNEHFELEVRVYENHGDEPTPLSGCKLGFQGWMPDHGHGMIVRPQATEVGEGVYRVRGMLFHMGGHWQFHIDVGHAGHSERADYDIML